MATAPRATDPGGRLHLLGLPAELQDMIFDYAYHRGPDVKLFSIKARRRAERAQRQRAPMSESSPSQSPLRIKIEEFLVSKEFFAAAATSYARSQEFDTFGTEVTLSAFHSGILSSLAHEATAYFMTCPYWTFESARALRVKISLSDFAQSEEEDDVEVPVLKRLLTAHDVRNLVAHLADLRGITRLELIPSQEHSLDDEQKRFWHANVKILEDLLSPKISLPKAKSGLLSRRQRVPLYPGSKVYLEGFPSSERSETSSSISGYDDGASDCSDDESSVTEARPEDHSGEPSADATATRTAGEKAIKSATGIDRNAHYVGSTESVPEEGPHATTAKNTTEDAMSTKHTAVEIVAEGTLSSKRRKKAPKATAASTSRRGSLMRPSNESLKRRLPLWEMLPEPAPKRVLHDLAAKMMATQIRPGPSRATAFCENEQRRVAETIEPHEFKAPRVGNSSVQEASTSAVEGNDNNPLFKKPSRFLVKVQSLGPEKADPDVAAKATGETEAEELVPQKPPRALQKLGSPATEKPVPRGAIGAVAQTIEERAVSKQAFRTQSKLELIAPGKSDATTTVHHRSMPEYTDEASLTSHEEQDVPTTTKRIIRLTEEQWDALEQLAHDDSLMLDRSPAGLALLLRVQVARTLAMLIKNKAGETPREADPHASREKLLEGNGAAPDKASSYEAEDGKQLSGDGTPEEQDGFAGSDRGQEAQEAEKGANESAEPSEDMNSEVTKSTGEKASAVVRHPCSTWKLMKDTVFSRQMGQVMTLLLAIMVWSAVCFRLGEIRNAWWVRHWRQHGTEEMRQGWKA